MSDKTPTPRKTLSEKFSELIDREKSLEALTDALELTKQKTKERIQAMQDEYEVKARELQSKLDAV